MADPNKLVSDLPVSRPTDGGAGNQTVHQSSGTGQRPAELEKALVQGPRPGRPGIPHRLTTGFCPASFAQSRLWYLDQLEPGVPLYNMQSAYRIRGPLDVAALERSVNEIVRRHEVLRTTFVAPEGELLQSIAPELSVEMPVIELTGDHAAVQSLAREHLRRPFDLARGPLLRLSLLRLAPDEHVLLLAMHHIVSDAWSQNILAQEMSVLYDAFTHGRPSPLPELTTQYADYSQWQRSMLQGEPLRSLVDFWKNQLAGAPPALDLPTDRARPREPSYNGARLTQPLPRSLLDAIQAFSIQQQCTPFMVCLAAFAIVLQRYTGQSDIVIGTPIANRTDVDVEGLIGFFVNTLAIRLDLSGNPTFRELLRRVREIALDAYDHQELPFEKLVEELQPQRDMSRHPLFQVLFQLLNLPQTPLRLAGADVEPLEVDKGIAPIELALSLISQAEPPEMFADFNTDLFDRSTMQRLLLHYQTLLEGAMARPDEPIGYLPLLAPAQRQRMLAEWNRPAAPDSIGKASLAQHHCLHQLFEAQAEHLPDAIALIFEQYRYTYHELNARANALARDLTRRGVAPDVPVGILIDHHPGAILAMLATLKAGGAYVPLNPQYPPERLAFILRDTGLRCVLTLPGTAHLLPAADIELLAVDLDQPQPTGESASNPSSTVTPDNLAYIIYTSGSTGVPRGVLVPHRGVSNVVAWGIAANDLGPGCRVSEVVSLSFDAAAFHLWMALASGAAVHLASQEAVLSPPAFADVLLQNAVTHIATTTSLMAALPAIDLRDLRALNVGGEACSPELVKRWAPGRRFFNQYGPTEASIVATAAECRPDGTRPSIGRPLPNTQAFILDRYLQPVPAGVTGELYLAGVGLGRGYLNQPGLTAERFMPNPFSAEPGARMYRTGDLARYLPDGNIDFVGRSDFQVKIRGFRVEPGETEAVLRQHPAVREAIVVTREDRPGDVRLIAYAVLHPQRKATSAELQEYLRQVLPQYMIPSAVVLLESLPLTSTGKVDRRALPAPSDSTPQTTEALIPPRTATEATIAKIWKEVLALDQIGVHDNFFDLGGHSLLAMRAIALIEKQLGVRLSPRHFVFQTLAQLAATCDKHPTQQMEGRASDSSGTPPSLGPTASARPPSGLRRTIRHLLGDKS